MDESRTLHMCICACSVSYIFMKHPSNISMNLGTCSHEDNTCEVFGIKLCSHRDNCLKYLPSKLNNTVRNGASLGILTEL